MNSVIAVENRLDFVKSVTFNALFCKRNKDVLKFFKFSNHLYANLQLFRNSFCQILLIQNKIRCKFSDKCYFLQFFPYWFWSTEFYLKLRTCFRCTLCIGSIQSVPLKPLRHLVWEYVMKKSDSTLYLRVLALGVGEISLP